MYVEEFGNREGETVVLLHGGGMAGWMWQKQREAVEDYHLLIPDLPDHGRSRDEGVIDIADAAQRVAELIHTRANGGTAHVIGHSLGAKIAVQLLATRPELMRRAVIGSALFRAMPLLNLTLNMPSYRLTVWMLKQKGLLAMQANQFKFPNEYYRQNFVEESSLLTAERLDRIYSQLNKYVNLPQGLEQARVPTLVVAGQGEPKAMRLSAIDIRKALPSAEACLICGAVHTYPWAQADVFNGLIRSWLRGEVSASSSIEWLK